MNNVIGVLFAESYHCDLGDLTSLRPQGAVPILGRFRMIDFPLSNMVNSGIVNVAVVTRDNYHSLMGHLESGKEWNLARKRYGLTLFPPFSNSGDGNSDKRMDILYGLLGFLKMSSQDYVLLSESNVIVNTTFNELFENHKNANADISIVYKEIKEGNPVSSHETYLVTDENGKLTNVENGNNISNTNIKYAGFILINKNVLISIIEHAHIEEKRGFFYSLVSRSIGKYNINLYELKGYSRRITSIRNYYNCSMDVLDKSIRDQLFNGQNWIYTKSKDTAPTKYLENAKVTNSLIADGCEVNGIVKNSVIFRNVKISKGVTVENSIIMQDCEIGENVTLRNVILDKDVKVRSNEDLIGTSAYPIVVGKGKNI